MNFSDLSSDPLGIGLMTRAQDRQRNYAMGEGFGHPSFGPLRNPQWDAFFQALDEKGVSKLRDNSVGEASGMFPDSTPLPSTYDTSLNQSSAVDSMPSNQLGTTDMTMPGAGQSTVGMRGQSIPSMDALLQKSTRAGVKNPRAAMKVLGQRGTTATNQTERG